MPLVICENIEASITAKADFQLGKSAHIWRINISERLHLLEHADSLLSKDEHERANRYLQQHNTQRFIVSRVALRFLLGKYLGMIPGKIVFSKGIDKKPFVQNREAHDIHFNVSHSGDIVLIAISGSEVGIDVEYIDNDFLFADVLPVCFSEEEQEIVGESRPLFYQLWTRKEALRKATGKGIDDELAFVPCLDGIHSINAAHIGSSRDWNVSSFEIGKDYVASIACCNNTELQFLQFPSAF